MHNKKTHSFSGILLFLLASYALYPVWAADPGVTETSIRIGSVMDLTGPARGLGQRMKLGIETALAGQTVQNRSIELIVLDDAYDPEKTTQAIQQLIDEGIFAALGNVGSPTTQAALPLLAEHDIPAIGFLSGSDILRPGIGDVINFRASYASETAEIVETALAQGIAPTEICAYIQNDDYGLAGLKGVRQALENHAGTEQIVEQYNRVIDLGGANPNRNNYGPVGVYRPETVTAKPGYLSLKNWERESNNRCRLIVTVGTYEPVAQFIGYARYKGEDWLITAVSATSAEDFRQALEFQGIDDKVIMTQIVPVLNSELPIVQEAQQALGEELSFISLEGYIVGKMFLTIMNSIEGDITRENFLAVVRGNTFDVSGLDLDFSEDNQGSDFVTFTYVDEDGYRLLNNEDWQAILQ